MKRIVTILGCLCIAMWCRAQTIYADEAYQQAKTFMTQRGRQIADQPVAMRKAMPQTAPQAGQQTALAYYVFDAKDDGGFVIISGDSRTEGIVGYADSGRFDEQTMPDNMRAWLQGYADEIAALREGKATARRVPTHAAVAPLLTTRWDQGTASADGDAYNQLCPTIDGVHCMVGCVAVAMAQVMRYTQWPTGYSEVIPAYKANETIGNLSALPAVKFSWSQMQDHYRGSETSAQRTAVARLMRYCGQSLEMDYGTDASSATTDYVAKALRSYFGYDTNTRFVMRSDYTAEGWDQLIYKELKAARPVLYRGSSTGGGHAFVCDGYDGNGLYHINWGWGGSHDGYFRLSLLNPDGGGTGSSGTKDGYTMTQGAVVGIRKATANTDDKRILNLSDMTYSGSVIEATYWNRTGMDGTFQYGLAYQEVNTGGDTFYLSYMTDAFNAMVERTFSCDVNTLNLDDGTYRFYPFSRVDGADWYRVQGDMGTYVEAVMKNGVRQSMSYHPRGDLHIKSVTCTGNLVVDMPQEVRIKVNNTGDEFNNLFYLFASQNNEKGEPVNKTNMVIETGATEEGSLYFTPTKTGTWNLWIDINETGSHDIGPYPVQVIAAPTGQNNLTLVSYAVDVTGDGVDVHARVKNSASQYYYRPVGCALFTEDSSTSIMLQYSGSMSLAAGQSIDLDYHFEGLQTGKRHYAMMAQYKKHSDKSPAVFGNRMWFTPTATDIEGVMAEEDDPPGMTDTWTEPSDVYSLTGVLLRRGATTLHGLPSGVYVVNGRKRIVK